MRCTLPLAWSQLLVVMLALDLGPSISHCPRCVFSIKCLITGLVEVVI